MAELEMEELRKETAEYLFQYLNQGVIPEEQLLEKLIPEDSDLPRDKIEDFETLVDIHFLMREDVIKFISKLENRLRTIKTDTKSKKTINRGEVDGKIDWENTIKTRHSVHPKDNSVFVVQDKKENHDIDRNILLKAYLEELIQIFDNVSEIIEDKDWAEEKWELDQSQSKIKKLRKITENNIHLQKIRDTEDYEPTERMIEKAEQSRRSLYRDAAQGIKKRKEYHNGENVAQLLNTVVQPEDDTMLELGLVFETINQLKDLGKDYYLKQIKTEGRDKKWIAQVELPGNKTVNIYHDETSSKTDFKPDKDEIEKDISSQYEDILDKYFDSATHDTTRRPDMILELKNEGETIDYLLAEVKNKDHTRGAKKGVEELLEYMAYGTEDGNPIFASEKGKFGSGLNGILLTRKLETENKELGRKHPIEILQYSNDKEWSDRLHIQLERWVISNLK